MKTPSRVFKKNPRPLPRVRSWSYPPGWERRWVKGNGEISRGGTRRYVGEAFVRDYVGLKPTGAGIWDVYFGPKLVGQLHEKETGNIRTATYARAR